MLYLNGGERDKDLETFDKLQNHFHSPIFYHRKRTDLIEKAIDVFENAAKEWNPEAQYVMGVIYGEGVMHRSVGRPVREMAIGQGYNATYHRFISG